MITYIAKSTARLHPAVGMWGPRLEFARATPRKADLSHKWPPAVIVRDKILPVAALAALQSSAAAQARPGSKRRRTAEQQGDGEDELAHEEGSMPAHAAGHSSGQAGEAALGQASEESNATLWEVRSGTLLFHAHRPAAVLQPRCCVLGVTQVV